MLVSNAHSKMQRTPFTMCNYWIIYNQERIAMGKYRTKPEGVLEQKDTWNHLVKEDCAKTHTTEGSLWCNLCNREVPVPNGGNSINQHAREEKSFRLVLNFAAKI